MGQAGKRMREVGKLIGVLWILKQLLLSVSLLRHYFYASISFGIRKNTVFNFSTSLTITSYGNVLPYAQVLYSSLEMSLGQDRFTFEVHCGLFL